MRPCPPALRRLVFMIAAGAAAVAAAPVHAAPPERAAERLPGQYIVVYERSVDHPGATSDRLARTEGFRTRLRYRSALQGFAARLTDAQLARVEAHPAVAFVTPDRLARASAIVPLASGDSAPAGVRRMRAATATTAREASTVNVAVLDTGIDLSHPDLNAAAGRDCVAGGTAADDQGHGTHVAGTIGARNDGRGVVGAAPGTRLYAVKVLDRLGNGAWSQIICGIDWVTSTRTDGDPANDVTVANMSLGGAGAPVQTCSTTTDALHAAICRSTAAGVTYVVAAGNDGWEFDYAQSPDVPAAYPEVLAVTAVSDSDGAGGALGGAPTCWTSEADDRYASFSNFAATAAGEAHTVAGPGVCVRSTVPGGGYGVKSGTSMAAPHVSGGLALCFGEAGTAGPCHGMTPAQAVARVRSDAKAATAAEAAFGFAGDPLRPVAGRYYGHLYAASQEAAPPPASTSGTFVPSAVTATAGRVTSGTAAALGADDNRFLWVASTTSGTRRATWEATVPGVQNAIRTLRIAVRTKNSLTCAQTVAVFNHRTAAWVQLDARNVGTAEVLADRTVSGTLADHVGGDAGAGDVRVRVSCSHATKSFNALGETVRVTTT